jgi:hypothetical protein
MEFDKSRVFTALNADELKPGSKVIVADNIEGLKICVKNETSIRTMIEVLPESNSHRFVTDDSMEFLLAYLISEPEEKKLKVSDLKLGDIVRHKSGNLEYLVTSIDHNVNAVFFANDWYRDEELGNWEKVEK